MHHYNFVSAFLAAMGRAGGGRNEVDPRFISMFSVFNIQFPSDDAVTRIYVSILRGHLSIFPAEFSEVADALVNMTISLFKQIIVELPPTPSKFHYIFNLKDLSRVFAGMLQLHPNHFKETRQLIRVWRNEFFRVICDRLINDQDVKLVSDRIAAEVKKNFPPENLSIQSDSEILKRPSAESVTNLSDYSYIMRDPLLFGDYRNTLNEEDGRFYEDLLDFEAVYFLFQEILEEYNERKPRMKLVLFEDCLEHLTRVHRTLRLPHGHVLLIGVGGSGKKCVTRLAAFAAGCDLFEIVLSKGYNENTLKEDLKVLYNKIGVENKKTVFVFTAAQVSQI